MLSYGINFVSRIQTYFYYRCNDPFSHGAYALYLPYQEMNLRPTLMRSFDNLVYFVGEHISTAHAWVEGALLSSLRVLSELQQEKFDIVIIGGGLLGLQTAIELANRKPMWQILVLEGSSFLSSTCSNQYELLSTNQTRQQYLHFGSDVIDGQFNSTDLMHYFYFNNLPNNYQGKLNGNLDFVNVTEITLNSLNTLKQEKYINVTLRENESFISYAQNQIISNRRSITVRNKILFLENCDINDYVKSLLSSIQTDIKIERFPLLVFPSIRTNPITWLYNNQLLGYSVNDTKSETRVIVFNSTIDNALSWLNQHASLLMDTNAVEYESNYKQTTLTYQNNAVDYILKSNTEAIVFISRTDIGLYPTWIKILVNSILNISKPGIVSSSTAVTSTRRTINNALRLSISMKIFLFTLVYTLFKEE